MGNPAYSVVVTGAPRGMISTGEVAKYFGWPYSHVAARKLLGLGPKPVKIGMNNFYPFEDTLEWRSLWFDRPASLAGAPRLKPVIEALYENQQWRITSEGIEQRDDPDYLIEPDRLTETAPYAIPGGVGYDWPIHMAGKPWVDLEQFIDAFVWAIDRFGAAIDETILKRSLDAARQERRRLYGQS